MAQLTWQNVAAPDLSASIAAQAKVSELLANAFKGNQQSATDQYKMGELALNQAKFAEERRQTANKEDGLAYDRSIAAGLAPIFDPRVLNQRLQDSSIITPDVALGASPDAILNARKIMGETATNYNATNKLQANEYLATLLSNAAASGDQSNLTTSVQGLLKRDDIPPEVRGQLAESFANGDLSKFMSTLPKTAFDGDGSTGASSGSGSKGVATPLAVSGPTLPDDTNFVTSVGKLSKIVGQYIKEKGIQTSQNKEGVMANFAKLSTDNTTTRESLVANATNAKAGGPIDPAYSAKYAELLKSVQEKIGGTPALANQLILDSTTYNSTIFPDSFIPGTTYFGTGLVNDAELEKRIGYAKGGKASIYGAADATNDATQAEVTRLSRDRDNLIKEQNKLQAVITQAKGDSSYESLIQTQSNKVQAMLLNLQNDSAFRSAEEKDNWSKLSPEQRAYAEKGGKFQAPFDNQGNLQAFIPVKADGTPDTKSPLYYKAPPNKAVEAINKAVTPTAPISRSIPQLPITPQPSIQDRAVAAASGQPLQPVVNGSLPESVYSQDINRASRNIEKAVNGTLAAATLGNADKSIIPASIFAPRGTPNVYTPPIPAGQPNSEPVPTNTELVNSGHLDALNKKYGTGPVLDELKAAVAKGTLSKLTISELTGKLDNLKNASYIPGRDPLKPNKEDVKSVPLTKASPTGKSPLLTPLVQSINPIATAASGVKPTTDNLSLDTKAGVSVPAQKSVAIPDNVTWGEPLTVFEAARTGAGTSTRKAVVTFVGDGDTVTLNRGERSKVNCRIDSIDAPEVGHSPGDPNQSFGPEARDELKRMILNKEVTVKVSKPTTVKPGPLTGDNSKDLTNYARDLCQIEISGENIDKPLLRKGLVWLYDYFVKGTDGYEGLKALETKAKQNKLGIFSEPNPLTPKEFRDLKKRNR